MFEAKLPARKFRNYVSVGRYTVSSNDRVIERCDSDGSEKDDGVERQEVIDVTKAG